MHSSINYLSLALLLTACQNNNENIKEPISVEQVNVENNMETGNLPKLACKTKKSPPIQDKKAIRTMLEKSGKITTEMTEEYAMKIVNDYIRKKQSSSHCKNK
ncbi:MAG: hypothetical protein KC484_11515 [Colwelliaceae bacterium]|nr:hypothetical protein [Colwelliaceae bacterium]